MIYKKRYFKTLMLFPMLHLFAISILQGIVDISDPPVKDNTWYETRVVVQGKQIKIWLDGKLQVDYTEPTGKLPNPNQPGRKLTEGTFCLQAHDPKSVVYFKNLRVKRLD